MQDWGEKKKTSELHLLWASGHEPAVWKHLLYTWKLYNELSRLWVISSTASYLVPYKSLWGTGRPEHPRHSCRLWTTVLIKLNPTQSLLYKYYNSVFLLGDWNLQGSYSIMLVGHGSTMCKVQWHLNTEVFSGTESLTLKTELHHYHAACHITLELT